MNAVQVPHPEPERPSAGAILARGAAGLALSVAANAAVRAAAVALLGIGAGEFGPLGWGPPLLFTAAAAVAATLVYALVSRVADHPDRAFTWLAAVALALSFIPDAQLLMDPAAFGEEAAPPAAVAALALMHVVAAALIVAALTGRLPGLRARR